MRTHLLRLYERKQENANLDHITSRRERERTSSRIYLQGTRKLGCHAHIDICEYRLYPEYALSATETKCLKSKQLRQLRESKLLALKQALEEGKSVDVVTKFFVFFYPHMNHMRSLTQLA